VEEIGSAGELERLRGRKPWRQQLASLTCRPTCCDKSDPARPSQDPDHRPAAAGVSPAPASRAA